MEKHNSRERGRLTGVTTVLEPPYYPPCAAAASLIHLLHRENDEHERLKTHLIRFWNTDNPSKTAECDRELCFHGRRERKQSNTVR